jgi:hypothetical protein
MQEPLPLDNMGMSYYYHLQTEPKKREIGLQYLPGIYTLINNTGSGYALRGSVSDEPSFSQA